MPQRLLRQIETPQEWLQTMCFLAGCEALNITEHLADLAVKRLIELEPIRKKILGIMMEYLATVQPTEHSAKAHEKWNRTLFYEWSTFSFLGYLLEHPGPREEQQDKEERTMDVQEAFELLESVGWYKGSNLHREVAYSIGREANLAFGFWYRTAYSEDDRQVYLHLIGDLLSRSSSEDHERAFFLIRHSEPTGRQLALVVDAAFKPPLERIARDRHLEFIHKRYGDFFRVNKVHLP